MERSWLTEASCPGQIKVSATRAAAGSRSSGPAPRQPVTGAQLSGIAKRIHTEDGAQIDEPHDSATVSTIDSPLPPIRAILRGPTSGVKPGPPSDTTTSSIGPSLQNEIDTPSPPAWRTALVTTSVTASSASAIAT